MACYVANRMNAKCLILNHFSQRYKPIGYVKQNDCNNSEKSEEDSNVQKLLDEAKLDFNGDLIASYDFFTYKF